MLEISGEDARALGLRQIIPAKPRRERRAEAERKRRAQKGAKPRAEWLAANSASRTRPWEQLGMGRSTYHKHLKSGPCQNCPRAEAGQVRVRDKGNHRDGATALGAIIYPEPIPTKAPPPTHHMSLKPAELTHTGT